MSELEMTRKTFLLFRFVYKICVERLIYFHGRMSLFAEHTLLVKIEYSSQSSCISEPDTYII